MASINVDVDIDIVDYLDEVEDADLVEEMESRGYDCYKSQKRPMGRVDADLTMLDGYKLRDHMLAITMQGSYVTDEELFNKLKELMKR